MEKIKEMHKRAKERIEVLEIAANQDETEIKILKTKSKKAEEARQMWEEKYREESIKSIENGCVGFLFGDILSILIENLVLSNIHFIAY